MFPYLLILGGLAVYTLCSDIRAEKRAKKEQEARDAPIIEELYSMIGALKVMESEFNGADRKKEAYACEKLRKEGERDFDDIVEDPGKLGAFKLSYEKLSTAYRSL